MVKRAKFSLTMCNLRSKTGDFTKVYSQKFCYFKKYAYLCDDSSHHVSHLHSVKTSLPYVGYTFHFKMITTLCKILEVEASVGYTFHFKMITTLFPECRCEIWVGYTFHFKMITTRTEKIMMHRLLDIPFISRW